MRVGPGHADAPRLQRLAQRIEHRTLEFGQLVQEQHAQVGETHLSRPDAKAPAHQRGHGGGVVRGAVGPRPRHPAARERACDRSDHRDLQRLRHYVANAPRRLWVSAQRLANVSHTVARLVTPLQIGARACLFFWQC